MTTLNTVFEYGVKFGIFTDKYFKLINAYAIDYFSKIDYNNIYLYIIVFLIYLSVLLTKIHNITESDTTINRAINYNNYIDPMVFLFLITYIIVIIKRLIGNYDFSIHRSIILLVTFLSFYNTINKSNSDIGNDDINFFMDNKTLVQVINIIIGVFYLFLYIPLIVSYGDVPDFFYIGFVLLTSSLYLISPICRSNYFEIIKNQSFTFVAYVIVYALFKNISKFNSRTINVMHVILIISIVLTYIATTTLIDNPLESIVYFLPLQKSTIDNIINYDSISYIYRNSSETDCMNFTSNKYNCNDKYDYYDLRKNKINNDNLSNHNFYNILYKFTGSFNIFIVQQLMATAIQYIFIYIILIRLPNPSKLYLKFFAYMFIINITVFYLNTLIKEYNLFNLRNLLYGNSEACFVVDSENPNINKTFGVIANTNKYKCINKKLDNDSKSTRWIDLYNYIDYPNINKDDNKYNLDINKKFNNINYVGVVTSIYGILYFLLVYTCDYLAYWNNITPLQIVPYLVLLIVIVIYIIVYNQNSGDIQNFDNIKYNSNNQLSDNQFFNDGSFTKMIDDYKIKEIITNILLITIINTILFATHKFYD